MSTFITIWPILDPALMRFGYRHEHGDPQRLLVGPALVAQVMLAPEVAVVAGENEEGIVKLLILFERFQESSNAFIDGGQTA
jgi:hypothetical protein